MNRENVVVGIFTRLRTLLLTHKSEIANPKVSLIHVSSQSCAQISALCFTHSLDSHELRNTLSTNVCATRMNNNQPNPNFSVNIIRFFVTARLTTPRKRN